jgi:hypothetical protein
MRWAALAACLAGCTTFEDPDIVIDLRVIAMQADKPEQVVDVDLSNPQQPAMLLSQLDDATVCAYVADPARDRELRYTLTLCSHGGEDRCSTDADTVIGSGIVDDPETSPNRVAMCAPIAPNANLLGVLLDTLDGDVLGGLGGVDYMVQLAVGGVDADPALDQFAAKWLRVAPRIPVARQANRNPTIERLDAAVERADAGPLMLRRCADGAAPLTVRTRDTVRLTPIEAPGAREDYVVPTLDGMGRMFTESLTYQWIASAGGFSAGTTGGPRDISGNPQPLFTDWHAPSAADLAGPTDVTLWMIQRDERYGVQLYETCIHVEL